MKTLLLMGDPLIEYGDWSELLPEYLTVNRGVSGEAVGELSARLGWEIERTAEPDHIFIMSGTNNLLMGDQSFPAIFTTMLPRLKQLESRADITVVGLAPVNLPWIPDTTLESVNSTLKETACGAGCLFLELTSFFHLHCRPVGNPCFLPDGVHFSPHGYRVLASAVREHLETLS